MGDRVCGDETMRRVAVARYSGCGYFPQPYLKLFFGAGKKIAPRRNFKLAISKSILAFENFSIATENFIVATANFILAISKSFHATENFILAN